MSKCPVCQNQTQESICPRCGYNLELDQRINRLSKRLSPREIKEYHEHIQKQQKIYQDYKYYKEKTSSLEKLNQQNQDKINQLNKDVKNLNSQHQKDIQQLNTANDIKNQYFNTISGLQKDLEDARYDSTRLNRNISELREENHKYNQLNQELKEKNDEALKLNENLTTRNRQLDQKVKEQKQQIKNNTLERRLMKGIVRNANVLYFIATLFATVAGYFLTHKLCDTYQESLHILSSDYMRIAIYVICSSLIFLPMQAISSIEQKNNLVSELTWMSGLKLKAKRTELGNYCSYYFIMQLCMVVFNVLLYFVFRFDSHIFSTQYLLFNLVTLSNLFYTLSIDMTDIKSVMKVRSNQILRFLYVIATLFLMGYAVKFYLFPLWSTSIPLITKIMYYGVWMILMIKTFINMMYPKITLDDDLSIYEIFIEFLIAFSLGAYLLIMWFISLF